MSPSDKGILVATLGLTSVIAHNMAKYMSNFCNFYTVEEFAALCRIEMKQHNLPSMLIRKIMSNAINQAEEDVHILEAMAIRMQLGNYSTSPMETNGGSNITVQCLLEGPCLKVSQYLKVLQPN